MVLEFRFPDVGEGINEGVLVKWLVREGSKVKADQPVAEIETGKAVVEIPCPKNGIMQKFFFKEGQTVKVGDKLFELLEEGETWQKKQNEMRAVKEEDKKNIEKESQMPASERESVGVVGDIESVPVIELTAKPKSTPKENTGENVLALPATRKLALDLGIDLAKIKGTGQNGRITSEDVQKAAQIKKSENALAGAPQVNFDKYGRIISIPLTPTRKEIARAMTKSMFSSPHAVAMEEIDITELAEIRQKEKIAAENKGIHLTFLAFLAKACVSILKDHSYLNAFFDEEKQQIIVKQYYNIGIAVDTPQGLLVPVVKDAVKKSILDVAHDIELLAEKARNRTIALDELKGGTFTITNYGSIAGIFGVPIINYGESAILGIGRAQDKPMVVEGKIVVRKMLPVSLSFDHRVADGAQAAEFLADLKKHLEDPKLLLVEMD